MPPYPRPAVMTYLQQVTLTHPESVRVQCAVAVTCYLWHIYPLCSTVVYDVP